MPNTALILAAGTGTRMGLDKSKLLLMLGKKPVIEHAVSAFYNHPDVDRVIVVCRECDQPVFREILSAYPDVLFTLGGATRQQSVMGALTAVPADTAQLLIHDGARPLITADIISRAVAAAKGSRAAAAGVPVKDTVKIVDRNGLIISTPDRASLVSIQTPQVFEYTLYLDAVSAAQQDGVDLTDDCQLVERLGVCVQTVMGDYGNIKITTREDILLAESILKSREVK